jgi:hypothetical protein
MLSFAAWLSECRRTLKNTENRRERFESLERRSGRTHRDLRRVTDVSTRPRSSSACRIGRSAPTPVEKKARLAAWVQSISTEEAELAKNLCRAVQATPRARSSRPYALLHGVSSGSPALRRPSERPVLRCTFRSIDRKPLTVTAKALAPGQIERGFGVVSTTLRYREFGAVSDYSSSSS